MYFNLKIKIYFHHKKCTNLNLHHYNLDKLDDKVCIYRLLNSNNQDNYYNIY